MDVFEENEDIEDIDDEDNEDIPNEDFELDCGLANQGGKIVRYNGDDWIEGIPTRETLVTATDTNGISATIQKHADANKPIFFMPNDIEETNEYIHGVPVYALRVFGIMMDGSKADVLITGIDVFFDVAVPPSKLTSFDAQLRLILSDIDNIRIESINAYPSRGYNITPKPYKRIYTSNVQQRKKALAAIIAADLTTASDDRTCYYRKAAREYGLPLSDWAVLSNYEYIPGPTQKSPLCTHTFRVPVSNYKPLIDTMASKEKREAASKTKAKNPLLSKDRTLVMAWDIETHSSRGTGDVPNAEYTGDNCFMICITAHWKDDPIPLAQICIVDVETAPDPNWTTIICSNPKNILKAFALCWRALAPDIQSGFNDSNYDWPFIVEKARRLNVLGWMFGQMTASPRKIFLDETVLRWNYNADKKIKITAEEVFYSSYLKVPGCIPIDVRVCYKKLFPKSETPKAGSLKFYLEISGIAAKVDMPIKRMWQYYESALETEGEPDAICAEHMRQVSHYCVIDAVRCQQLLVRRNIINDYRETSSLAFMSLFDSHYYAGGMKVCNLLGAYAWRRNILTSMIPLEREESGKYPGAYVFPPEKGIVPDPGRLLDIEKAIETGCANDINLAFDAFEADRPTTGLDFASLYPSLIMTYNLSPDKILDSIEEANFWQEKGRKVHLIEFPFNGRTVRGWSIQHENIPEEIGLYPSVLIDLFAKRAEMKVILNVHGATKELLELVFAQATQNNVDSLVALQKICEDARTEYSRTNKALEPDAEPPKISPGSTLAEEMADLRRLNRIALEQIACAEHILTIACSEQAIKNEYDRACFDWTCANTKQNALKIYMNTFYGEAGNSLSPFFLLQLAGGVTSAGQYNIKLVADFVKSNGFRIKYGDTDSLYLVAPNKYFKDCDADYAAKRINREEWMSAMVRITMRALNQIRDDVNKYLYENNGSKYLKMAYEEVLYPVVFTGKKKYFGIPHLNEVNFHPKKLFIRGIDVVKQGQPGLAREIGYRIMWACMALDNNRTLLQIVEDTLRDAVINGTQWNFDHFVKTDAWKPNKNNKPVQRFIARMRGKHAIEMSKESDSAHLYEIPEPGERFSYIIAKTGASFDLQGRKSALKKGDRMEFANAARKLALEIDVAFYMVSYVVGLCARFINGDPTFQPPPSLRFTEKKIDELSQKSAKKYLENFVKGLSNLDSDMLKKRGYAYRRAFGQASSIARNLLIDQIGHDASEVLHGEWTSFETFDDETDTVTVEDPMSKVVNNIWGSADNYSETLVGDNWCESLALKFGITSNGLDVNSESGSSNNLFGMMNRRRHQTSIVNHIQSSLLDRLEAEKRSILVDILPTITDISIRYETDLYRITLNKRHNEHIVHPEIGQPEISQPESEDVLISISEDDNVDLVSFRKIWFEVVAIQLVRRRNIAYNSHLHNLKNRRLGVLAAPSRVDRDKIIATAAAKLTMNGSILNTTI